MKYNPVKIIEAFLDFGKDPIKVGRLALSNRKIFFEYDVEFLKSEIEISPIKLPLKSRLLTCDDMCFDGVLYLYGCKSYKIPL